jgi:hypothetical protein
MKQARLEEICESYVNGNIGETKKAVKRMSKTEFFDFLIYMRANYYKPLDDMRYLTE